MRLYLYSTFLFEKVGREMFRFSNMMTKYIVALYAVLVSVTLLLIIGLVGYSYYINKKASRLEKQYDTLLHERNLIAQNYKKMRQEYEEKEEIYRAQEEWLKMLEEAETLDDYIKLWKEVGK